MILSEFESREGYNAELNWQTKSRLDMLSSAGGHPANGIQTNGTVTGNGLAHSISKLGSAGRRKAQRTNSLLDPEVEMSHSQLYQDDSYV